MYLLLSCCSFILFLLHIYISCIYIDVIQPFHAIKKPPRPPARAAGRPAAHAPARPLAFFAERGGRSPEVSPSPPWKPSLPEPSPSRGRLRGGGSSPRAAAPPQPPPRGEWGSQRCRRRRHLRTCPSQLRPTGDRGCVPPIPLGALPEVQLLAPLLQPAGVLLLPPQVPSQRAPPLPPGAEAARDVLGPLPPGGRRGGRPAARGGAPAAARRRAPQQDPEVRRGHGAERGRGSRSQLGPPPPPPRPAGLPAGGLGLSLSLVQREVWGGRAAGRGGGGGVGGAAGRRRRGKRGAG